MSWSLVLEAAPGEFDAETWTRGAATTAGALGDFNA